MPFLKFSSSFLLTGAPAAILGNEVTLEMKTLPARSIKEKKRMET
jgi:hypothetical protein